MIDIETVISTVDNLDRIRRLSKKLEKAERSVARLLNSSVASISLPNTCRACIDVKHRITCIHDTVIVAPLHIEAKYTARSSTIEAAGRDMPLRTVSLNPMTLCDLVVLTLYEKYDRLVSRIVEACGEGYEVLKRLVDASMSIVDKLGNIVVE